MKISESKILFSIIVLTGIGIASSFFLPSILGDPIVEDIPNGVNTTYANGTNVLSYDNGTIFTTYTNKTKITNFSNGTFITLFPNGTTHLEHTRYWIWTFSELEEKYWTNECFLEAVKLAEAIAKSPKGQAAYKKVNKPNQAFTFDEVEKTGLHPEISVEEPTNSKRYTWGWYEGEQANKPDDIIYINKKKIDQVLKNCNNDKRLDAIIIIAGVILHESAHWKENVMKYPDKDYDPDRGEEGEDLIWDIFGKILDTGTDGTLKNPTKKVDDDTKKKWADPNWWANQ